MDCPKCGTANLDTQRFCGQCATSLSVSQPAPLPPTWSLREAWAGLGRGWQAVLIAVGVIILAGLVESIVNMERPAVKQTGNVESAANPTTSPVASQPVSSPSALTAPASSSLGKWSSESSNSEMDSSKGHILRLQAESEVTGWMESYRPTLIIRCMERKIELYVVTGMASTVEGIYSNHTVRIRLDEQQPFKQQWYDSTDSKALFSRDASNLARRISQAKTMKFEFTPFNASPVIAEFDVRGLDLHLENVIQACRKK